MEVKIFDYGDEGEGKFIEYRILGLSLNQMKFLDSNLDDDTEIIEDCLILKIYFTNELYPFQSQTAKLRLDDFIAREEIEMNVFISSFLEEYE